jgi:hypothetical protein
MTKVGQWRFFGRLLAEEPDDSRREIRGRKLLGQIVDGLYRARYFLSDDDWRLNREGDKEPAEAEPVTFGQMVPGLTFDQGPAGSKHPNPPRTGHRCDRLPDYWRDGQFMDTWQFSAVTFGEQMIVELEIFFPGIARDVPAGFLPQKKPKRGRPSKEDAIKAEAERLVRGRHYATRTELARDIMRQVGRDMKTVCAHLRKLKLPAR